MAIENVNLDNFEEEVLNSTTPVLVDFYATWCGPCKLVMGHLSAMAGERNGDVKIVKVDVDQCPKLAEKYLVQGIPKMILFQNGVPADTRLSGFNDKGKLHAYVDSFLKQ